MNKRSVQFALTLLIPSSILVGLLAYLGSYSQLMADDFCSVYYAERLGVFRSAWYWYITWHGGYSAALADGVLGLFGRTGIGFVVPATVLIWLAVLTWVINSVLRKASFAPALLMALSLSVFILCGTFILSPTIKTSLLWWAALRGYIPPMIIFPFYLGLCLYFSDRTWSRKMAAFWCLGSFLVILFNAGFSETFTPLQLIILLSALVWIVTVKQWHKQITPFLLAGIAGAILGLMLMVAAPGNSNRQAFSPPPPALFEIIVISLKGSVYFAGTIFAVPAKIAMLIAVCVAGLAGGGLIFRDQEDRPMMAFVVLVAGLIAVFCCFPPAAYGQSTYPADHSLIIPSFILVIALMTACFLIGRSLALRVNRSRSVLFACLLVVLVASLGLAAFTTAGAFFLQVPNAIMYAEDWHLRDAQIQSEKLTGHKTVLVTSIKNWIGILEPIDNPKFFVNSCMSLYYDVNILSDKSDAFK